MTNFEKTGPGGHDSTDTGQRQWPSGGARILIWLPILSNLPFSLKPKCPPHATAQISSLQLLLTLSNDRVATLNTTKFPSLVSLPPYPLQILYSRSASKPGKQLNKISLGRALIASSERSIILFDYRFLYYPASVPYHNPFPPEAKPANPHTRFQYNITEHNGTERQKQALIRFYIMKLFVRPVAQRVWKNYTTQSLLYTFFFFFKNRRHDRLGWKYGSSSPLPETSIL